MKNLLRRLGLLALVVMSTLYARDHLLGQVKAQPAAAPKIVAVFDYGGVPTIVLDNGDFFMVVGDGPYKGSVRKYFNFYAAGVVRD